MHSNPPFVKDLPYSAPGRFSTPAGQPVRPAPWRMGDALNLFRQVGSWFTRISQLPLLQTKTRRLRISETVSLGDKRFVSIVQVDGVEYLLGVGTAQVSLLTRLGDPSAAAPSFEQVATAAWRSSEAS